jgi:chromosome partitioning protein
MDMHTDAPPGDDPPPDPVTDARPAGRVACVANMKGGVGKTTATVMLADALAASGRRVAVLDLDPQASASLALAGDDGLADLVEEGRVLDAFLRRRLVDRKKAEIGPLVAQGVTRTYDAGLEPLAVSLMACSQELRAVERQVVRLLSKKGDWDHVEREVHAFLRDEVVGPLRAAFDWVVIDCAPGLGLLATAALALADEIVVATVPEPLSLYGLDAFLAHGWGRDDGGMPPPAATPRILATCVGANDEGHARTLQHLRDGAARPGAAYGMFTPVTHRSPNLAATAFVENLPIGYETKYTQAQRTALAELVAEIEEGALARA